jgi:hypothetical protein
VLLGLGQLDGTGKVRHNPINARTNVAVCARAGEQIAVRALSLSGDGSQELKASARRQRSQLIGNLLGALGFTARPHCGQWGVPTRA